MTDINLEQLAKAVGRAIARQRQQAGLTQEQVAEHLTTVVRLAELAQLFDCELADFLRETSNRPTEQGIVLSQQLARLDDVDRTLLLETVERLVERLARPR